MLLAGIASDEPLRVAFMRNRCCQAETGIGSEASEREEDELFLFGTAVALYDNRMTTPVAFHGGAVMPRHSGRFRA